MGEECSLLVKNRLKTDKVQEPVSQPSANVHGTPGCRSPGTMRAKTPGVRGRRHEPGARATVAASPDAGTRGKGACRTRSGRLLSQAANDKFPSNSSLAACLVGPDGLVRLGGDLGHE